MKRECEERQLNKLLEVYPVLDRINRKADGVIGNTIRFKQLSAGEYMQSREYHCSDLLFVISGILKIEKIDENGKVMKLYELGPGEICHEVLSCYMNCEKLNLLGQAVTDMEVALVPMRVVDQYMISDLDFMKFMYVHLYDKFRKVVLDKEEIIHESMKNRLVKYLRSKHSNTIYVTHQEIAFELGTAREVVSRNLKQMEKKGMIQLERNRIRIVDLDKVQSIR